MLAVPTIHVILKKFVDKAGEQMILIRITFQRKSFEKSLGIKTKREWFNSAPQGFKFVSAGDKMHEFKNTRIRKEYESMEARFYEAMNADILTIDMVKAIMESKGSVTLRIADIAKEYISTLENKDTRHRWEDCMDRINDFAPGESIVNVNKNWLQRFENHLNVHYNFSNSRIIPMKFLRACINYAMDKKNVQMEYPFGTGRYRLPKAKKTKRDHLTTEELQRLILEHDTNPNPDVRKAAAWFILQCYSGLRFSDILDWKDSMVRDNRVYFIDQKTKTPHFIPIYRELQEAIDRVKLYDQLKSYEWYKVKLKLLGAALKLSYNLNSHIGRHTFAVHQLELGSSISAVQAYLGHKDVNTTKVYLKITDRLLLDDMYRSRGTNQHKPSSAKE